MSDIVLVNKKISLAQLKDIAAEGFGDMVKGVVDIEKKIMVLGGELHADGEAYLLDRGSKQDNLWGINLYPELEMPERLEFDSLINIRPSQNNNSRTVEDTARQKQIVDVADSLVRE